jgi:hypothetical protein
MACLLGYLAAKSQELTFNLPLLQIARLAASDLVIHVCLITALLRTNFTTMIVVNNCSIISVIVVGAYCSGVDYGHAQEGEAIAEEG